MKNHGYLESMVGLNKEWAQVEHLKRILSCTVYTQMAMAQTQN